MRSILVTAAVFAFLATSSSAMQPRAVGYVIKPHVFAASADGSRSTDLIGPTVMLRTAAGMEATINLENGPAGTSLGVVPADLGSGHIALRVRVSVITAGQTSTAKFAVLGGPLAQQTTVALRDANGKFLLSADGLPIYATFDVTTLPQR
jgi:hypothetical protein